MKYCLLLTLLLLNSLSVLALKFPEPSEGNDIVGKTQTVVLQKGEDYSTIAQRFDLGYYEILEANIGVDPDTVGANTLLVLPTEYILPAQLKPNTIVVNIAEMRLYYWAKNTREIFIFPIGIGKEDWITPVGSYHIAQKIRHPVWTVPKSILEFRAAHGYPVEKTVGPGPDNPLGDFALRLYGGKASGSYLIHGSNDPLGIGRRSSAGCIRLYEQDIESLFNVVSVGTQVEIVNEPFKIGVKGDGVYLEAHMPLYEQRVEMKGNYAKVANLAAAFGENNQSSYIDKSRLEQVAKDHLGIPRIIGAIKR